MIDSQLGATCLVGDNHLIPNKREWNNCFIKNNQEILVDFADFALQEQLLEDNLMVSISQAWYNGSYTMAAKPIKSLKLHYAMIQCLIIYSVQENPWDCREWLQKTPIVLRCFMQAGPGFQFSIR